MLAAGTHSFACNSNPLKAAAVLLTSVGEDAFSGDYPNAQVQIGTFYKTAGGYEFYSGNGRSELAKLVITGDGTTLDASADLTEFYGRNDGGNGRQKLTCNFIQEQCGESRAGYRH